ncbi:MAG TPA: tetrathionate reductase family octaheme c-type cytochrome, partial [Anaerolineales bacterium]|nr:tetrathionate reductase family octaheme c-type cytochrome [Anaerolineales bacterium]
MKPQKHIWLFGLVGTLIILIVPIIYLWPKSSTTLDDPWAKLPERPPHTEHADLYEGKTFETGFDVTRACLECHEDAAHQVMQTVHWTWESKPVEMAGRDEPVSVGKKTSLNNFCIGIQSNWSGCTKCHAGYGWSDASFDFSKEENVDCLICHADPSSYAKGTSGLPADGVDLLAAAKSVGFPRRENCGVCHNYGGGGQGVKHGDLDSRLDHPSREDDVHMGGLDFLCIDCHRAKQHRIPGRAFSVSVEGAHGVACTDCHREAPHADPRLNTHLKAVACQTCHIGTYARTLPTKMFWDWSKAGDTHRPDDPHTYLKIKGEFLYGHELVPEYAWFDRSVDRYLIGDRIGDDSVTVLNAPHGSIADTAARIWPFKVHRALLPFDPVNRTLMPPV